MKMKDLRLAQGLEQKDVAKALKVTQTCVSYHESGRMPRFDHGLMYAKLYKVTPEEILDCYRRRPKMLK